MRHITGFFCVVVGLLTTTLAAPARATALFHPEDFRYLGAFRLPEYFSNPGGGGSEDQLSWCKGPEAYYPGGDPNGPADGFPGSLYGIGHGWWTQLYELAIPVPVVSDDLNDLPVATLLQDPHDVASSIWVPGDGVKGVEYLPAMPGMSGPRLHICFGQHYQYDRRPTHGWVNLDLSNPQAAGAWNVGAASEVSDINTNEYIFAIPSSWADAHVGGKRLACGRHREGQMASGPSIIAYAPWQSGNPPSPGAQLPGQRLVLYKNTTMGEGSLEGHCWADDWKGGAWLWNDERMSVVIVGTKGMGDCWYGWQDGTTPAECDAMPGGCEANGYGGDNRGFWASYFRTMVLFYDPDDLARVASGELPTWDPQPYVRWDITPYMIQPDTTYEIGTGGVAYDQARGYLYISEGSADREHHKPVIHVFAIDPPQHPDEDGQPGQPGQQGSSATTQPGVYASPNPFRDATTIHLFEESAQARGPLRVAIYDVRGKLVRDFGAVPGASLSWDAARRPGGIYFVRASSGSRVWTSKLSLVR
jgi:hypothetical protein